MSNQYERTSQLALSRGPADPDEYSSQDAKARFAVAKYYGMGSDGEWSVDDIAEALDVSERQVYRYLSETDTGREVREVLATTEAEWRLDAALTLRREVERLEKQEGELLQRTTTVPTDFEEKAVEGIPRGNEQVVLSDQETHSLTLPVPSSYEEVTDYGPNLERIQKEKRQYLAQIANILGLDEWERHTNSHRPAEGSTGPLVEFRQRDDEQEID